MEITIKFILEELFMMGEAEKRLEILVDLINNKKYAVCE